MVINRRAVTTTFAFTAALWSVNVIWLRMDSRPPAWDMALHQTYALNYYPSSDSAAHPLPLWRRSGNYPPFVHIAIAFLYWLFHAGAHIAAIVNLPATFLLFCALYILVAELVNERSAVWTCALTSLIPLMIWLSRETILDYWLCAWVAVSLVALRRTRGFASARASLLFGCTLGMGLLTKWLFAGYLAAPLAYVCIQARIWKESRRVVHLADALLVGEAIAALWYAPNLSSLINFFFDNARIGIQEGEPPVFSLQSFIYYLRLLEGYQLFGLLFALLVVAILATHAGEPLKDRGFLLSTIAGGWLAMTLLRTKDPRFTMPLLGLLMIFPAVWLESLKGSRGWRLFKGSLVAILAVQAYAINFGIPWLPRSVILARGYQGSTRWDWNLYMQEFYGIFGPPRREDWKLDQIFRRMLREDTKQSPPLRVAVLPDLPRFNWETMCWRARLLGLPILADHPQSASHGIHSFDSFQFILMTEGDQGEAWSTRTNGALNKIIVDNPHIFRVLELYPLPNGDYVRLYSVSREAAKVAANRNSSSGLTTTGDELRSTPVSGLPREHLHHPLQWSQIQCDELRISQVSGYSPETSRRQIKVQVGLDAQPHQPPITERPDPEMRRVVVGILGAHFHGDPPSVQLSGQVGSGVWGRKREECHVQILRVARILDRVVNFGRGLVRESDHEETLGADIVTLGDSEEPIHCGDPKVLPRRVLISRARAFYADSHGMNSRLSHQPHEAVVHNLGPETVGKREAGFEPGLENKMENFASAVHVEIEDVVVNEELIDSVSGVKQLEFAQHILGRPSTKALAEDIMTVAAPVGASAARQDLNRPRSRSHTLRQQQAAVRLQIQQMVGGNGNPVDRRWRILRQIPDQAIGGSKYQGRHLAQVIAGLHCVDKTDKATLPLAADGKIGSGFPHNVLRATRDMRATEHDSAPGRMGADERNQPSRAGELSRERTDADQREGFTLEALS
ncbi:MAG TPA: glycosyltransferase family 39 protein [Acidobacteriota bacterium]|nr:glycosyltransferase family 39 protein [Acidobacteriota bacterium]